jgi:hypothetical protein
MHDSDYPFGISKLFLNVRLNFMIRECCYYPIVMATGVSGYMAISFLLFTISSKFALYLDCCLISPKFIQKLVNILNRGKYIKVRVIVFNATFKNISVISWQSVLFMGETCVPLENHQPAASHWKTLSHNVVSNPHHYKNRAHSFRDDRHWLHR